MREAHIPHGETDSWRAWEAIGTGRGGPSILPSCFPGFLIKKSCHSCSQIAFVFFNSVTISFGKLRWLSVRSCRTRSRFALNSDRTSSIRL